MGDFDLIEDMLAFWYCTQCGKKQSGSDDGVCEVCGAELETDPESGEDQCPDCDEDC